MALAWGVRTSVTMALNSSIIGRVTSLPFSLASAFFSEPRWSMAAAAITPRSFDTAFMPASLPGVMFIQILRVDFAYECRRTLDSIRRDAVLGCDREHENRGSLGILVPHGEQRAARIGGNQNPPRRHGDTERTLSSVIPRTR